MSKEDTDLEDSLAKLKAPSFPTKQNLERFRSQSLGSVVGNRDLKDPLRSILKEAEAEKKRETKSKVEKKD